MRAGKSYTQELFDDLERAGIIAKTGELRFDSKGRLQPVYALTELGKEKAAAACILAGRKAP
jgi:DNA-binding PadR family transcriptional regulator